MDVLGDLREANLDDGTMHKSFCHLHLIPTDSAPLCASLSSAESLYRRKLPIIALR